MGENPHEEHRSRMRRRFWEHGANSLLDHEVLEMLLYAMVKRQDTNPIAHRLLEQFRGFRGVLQASPQDLMTVDGVGKETAMYLCLLANSIGRYEREKLGDVMVLGTVNKAVDYCQSLFIGAKYEQFYLICLNAQNGVIRAVCISEGDVSEVSVYIRRIVEEVIHAGAASVLLAHNHPGGHAHPSDQDCDLTELISRALATIHVRLNDHIIVGDQDFFSFQRERLMPQVFSNPEYGLEQRQIHFKHNR